MSVHKNYFSRVLFLLTALLILLHFSLDTQAGFFSSKLKYNTLKTEHFYIHFPEGLGPIANEMQTISEDSYDTIVSRLGWRPWGRTHVVLSDKTDQPNGLATVIPYNYILLYVTPPDADSTLANYKDYLKILFHHEYAHIIHIDMHYRFTSPGRFIFGRIVAPNGATPGWMREGMAVYEESQLDEGFGRINSDYTMMVLRTAHFENNFPRIDQIAGLTIRYPGGLGPYLFGGMFFDWLAKNYGEERMYKFQKEYASSIWLFSLNNKARRVYGKSFYKLYKEFVKDYGQVFDKQKEKLSAKGLTPMKTVVTNKNSQKYYTPTPYPGGYAYFQSGLDDSPSIQLFTKKFTKDDKNDEGKAITFDKKNNLKKLSRGQMSFSKTGRYLAFSSLAAVESKTAKAEVYYYDLKKKVLARVKDDEHKTKAMRAMDPDFSPADGGQRWMVMVRNFQNTDQLYIHDLLEKRGYVITKAADKTQFSNPRFSPDGSKIVVSEFDPKTGFRDIVVYSKKGKRLYKITKDKVPDNHPVFSPNGRYVYYDSYKTGISNIFRYNLRTRRTTQVSNVLDGVFQPMPSADGSTLYVQRYNSEKTFIQKFVPKKYATKSLNIKESSNRLASPLAISFTTDSQPSLIKQTKKKSSPSFSSKNFEHTKKHKYPVLPFSFNPDAGNAFPDFLYGNTADKDTEKKTKKTKKAKKSKKEAAKEEKKEYPSQYKNALSQKPSNITFDTPNPPGTKKYHAFPQILVPRYILPNLLYIENAILASFAIGRTDPLFRHSWTAYATYRTDAAFVGGGGTYVYSRYAPAFYIGGIRYAVDWGDVNGIRFYEERNQAYAGVSWVIKKSKFNFAYFYEHRSALTNLAVNLVNMRPYAGYRFTYSIGKASKFANSISYENGYSLKIGGEWTDKNFGSDEVNEEIAIRGDLRFYLEMPWADHHVLAVRVAAGWVWGDQQQFGAYRLGGPFGEGPGVSYSSRLFPLRGLARITYGGDQAFIFSTEYRIPLATNVNKGIGTWPIFLNKLHMSLFVDGGDIKYRTEANSLFSRMLVSAGVEFSGDFVLGYGLPLTVRTGYGIVMTNRWRLGTLTDTITMSSLRYGSIYLQIGTMF